MPTASSAAAAGTASATTPTHTALHFPYAWWERAGADGPHPHVAARLREGVLAELRTVRDGRFDRPSTAAAARGAPDARAALDAATSFRRVDAEWRPRLDALRRGVEGRWRTRWSGWRRRARVGGRGARGDDSGGGGGGAAGGRVNSRD